MDTTRTCTTRLLPPQQRAAAAIHAVRTYAKNLPSGADAGDLLSDAADRLAVVVNKWWGPSVDLTVGFLDNPSRELRDKILLHLNAWSRDAAVRFHEVGTDPTIRIARLSDDDLPGFGGYWSYVGTDIDTIPADEPTMNFEGFTAAESDSEFHRVVRHEAGHSLGFPHEHMRQELVQRLDREKVIAAFMTAQGWTKQEVIDQVLTPLEESSLFGTAAADQTSIMCYQIAGTLTLDGKPITGGTDINEADHRFAARVYSGRLGNPFVRWRGRVAECLRADRRLPRAASQDQVLHARLAARGDGLRRWRAGAVPPHPGRRRPGYVPVADGPGRRRWPIRAASRRSGGVVALRPW